LAVKWVKGGQAFSAAAKELGLVVQTLRNWVKAAAAGKLATGNECIRPSATARSCNSWGIGSASNIRKSW